MADANIVVDINADSSDAVSAIDALIAKQKELEQEQSAIADKTSAEYKKVSEDIKKNQAQILAAGAQNAKNAEAVFNKAISDLAELKDAQLEIGEASGKNSIEYKKVTEDIKRQTSELNLLAQVMNNADGSGNQLRATTALLTRAYNSLGSEAQKTTQIYNEQKGQMENLAVATRNSAEAYREQQSAIGNNIPNIGNYTEAIKKAALDTSGLGGVIGGASEAYKLFTQSMKANSAVASATAASTGAVSTATSTLGVVSKATGVAMKGMWASGTLGLSLLIPLVVELITWFKDLDIISDSLGKTLHVVGVVIGDIADVLFKTFTGDFSGAFEVFTGIIDDAKTAVNDFDKAIENRSNISKYKKDIAELEQQVKSYVKVSQDSTKTDAEKLEALKKANELNAEAIRLEEERGRMILENIDKDLKFMQDSKAKRDLQAKRDEEEAASIQRITTLRQEADKIANTSSAITQKALDEEAKKTEEARKALEQYHKDRGDLIAKDIEMTRLMIAERKGGYEKELEALSISFEKQKASYIKFNVDISNITASYQLKRAEIIKKYLDNIIKETDKLDAEYDRIQKSMIEKTIENTEKAEKAKYEGEIEGYNQRLGLLIERYQLAGAAERQEIERQMDIINGIIIQTEKKQAKEKGNRIKAYNDEYLKLEKDADKRRIDSMQSGYNKDLANYEFQLTEKLAALELNIAETEAVASAGIDGISDIALKKLELLNAQKAELNTEYLEYMRTLTKQYADQAQNEIEASIRDLGQIADAVGNAFTTVFDSAESGAKKAQATINAMLKLMNSELIRSIGLEEALNGKIWANAHAEKASATATATRGLTPSLAIKNGLMIAAFLAGQFAAAKSGSSSSGGGGGFEGGYDDTVRGNAESGYSPRSYSLTQPPTGYLYNQTFSDNKLLEAVENLTDTVREKTNVVQISDVKQSLLRDSRIAVMVQ